MAARFLGPLPLVLLVTLRIYFGVCLAKKRGGSSGVAGPGGAIYNALHGICLHEWAQLLPFLF